MVRAMADEKITRASLSLLPFGVSLPLHCGLQEVTLISLPRLPRPLFSSRYRPPINSASFSNNLLVLPCLFINSYFSLGDPERTALFFLVERNLFVAR
jgi:hypothetical protein